MISPGQLIELHHIQRRQKDRENILNPRVWPLWPWFPLKRWWHKRVQFAVLIGAPEKFEVYRFNPSVVTRETDKAKLGMMISTARMNVYQDVDALLKDGWTGA